MYVWYNLYIATHFVYWKTCDFVFLIAYFLVFKFRELNIVWLSPNNGGGSGHAMQKFPEFTLIFAKFSRIG